MIGIDAISPTEYIVTMIAGVTIKVNIVIDKNSKHLDFINEEVIYKFDSNMKILSSISSKNNIFWSFLISTTTKLEHKPKNTKEILYLKLLKVKAQDILKPFIESKKMSINSRYLDILLGIKLDIISSETHKKRFTYIHALNESVQGLDDPLPLLQAGYFMAHQRRDYLW